MRTRLILILGTLAGTAGAQQTTFPPDIKPDTRVRILPVESPRLVVGRVVVGHQDSLLVETLPIGTVVRFRPTDVRSLETSVGYRRHPGTGALFGALGGVALGALIGFATYDECDRCFIDIGAGPQTAIGAAIGAPIGALIGVIIGENTQTEVWTDASPYSARLLIKPVRAGLGIGLKVRN